MSVMENVPGCHGDNYVTREDKDDYRLPDVTGNEYSASRDHYEDVPSTNLFDIPWDDVLFQYILPLLPVQTLFQLRRVCKTSLLMIKDYLSQTKEINIARIAGKVTTTAFHILTDENTNLLRLNLRNSKGWLSDELLMPVLKCNPRLQLLDLTNCTSVTNAVLQCVAVNCSGLQKLILRDCVWLSPEGVTVIGLYCKDLEAIDFNGCWNVNDESLSVLVSSCPRLKSVQLAKIYGLTDNSMTVLAKCSSQLYHLNIQGCWRITDDSIRFLAEYGKNLKMLQIRECHQVTEMTLSKLRENGVKMDKLSPPSSYPRVSQLLWSMRHKLNVQM
ncbi:F-box/LRR-repeat protein 15-like [Mercenaria mercenaria]|uniref:F-box/LRR-repeat protein 15-like n=1 Tax=Mercenaria mercenaria TaxID=6596 RepID=UPI00234F0031|nr:F-box/LRR-repeat protein 15-like [Mercenaria mercenaria]